MTTKQDFNSLYASEMLKYNSLILKESPLTTSGNLSFSSDSSGETYNSTAGEMGLLTALQTVLNKYIISEDDYTPLINGLTNIATMNGVGEIKEKANKSDFETLKNKFDILPQINVKNYGAKGDGVSLTDTLAIQTVLNLAKTNGSVSLVIPSGTYKITDRLIVYKNTKIEMFSDTILLRSYNAGFFMNGETTDVFTDYNGNGNIEIDGGILDGNIANFPQAYNSISLGRGSNITLKNITIKDVIDAHAMDLNACKDVLIENCRFLGYKDTIGESYFREAIQIANHTALGFSGFGNYDGTPCKNVIVRRCYFGASGTVGTTAYPTGVGNHGSVYSYYEDDNTQPDLYNRNIYIYNNVFEGMTFAGVRPFKYKNCDIYDNAFLKCKVGVAVSNPNGASESDKDQFGVTKFPQSAIDIKIHHNMFKDTINDVVYAVGYAKLGIVAKIRGLFIESNFIDVQTDKSSSVGYLKNVSNLVFKNNIMRSVGRGLYLAYVDNAEIHGNQGEDFALEGISTIEPDNGTVDLPTTSTVVASGYTTKINITNNTFKNLLYTGIFIQWATNFSISNNKLYSPATLTDNTRNGITIASYSENGEVKDNRVVKATSGNQNKYGIEVTSTCELIQLNNNQLQGKLGTELISSVNSFDGNIFYSPDGVKRKLTINNSGVAIVTSI